MEQRSRRRAPEISLTCLVALTFFSVTGGPFGQELIVRAGGPLLALSGLVVFTLLWSVPEAIMTAELSAAYPEAAGFAAWTNAAFGPFLAWIDSWCSWSSGVIDNAVYPILFLAYLEALTGGGPWSPASRGAFVVAFVGALTWLQWRGLSLTANATCALSAFVLAPFAVMCGLAVPQVRVGRWFRARAAPHWSAYLNNIFWNVNYYDSASAFSGDCVEPARTFPRAMALALVFISLTYLVPLAVRQSHSSTQLPRSLTPSLAHSLTHSLAHLLAHSLTHSLTRSLTRSLTHSPTSSRPVINE